jgi:Domain of unknown function (DUF1906)
VHRRLASAALTVVTVGLSVTTVLAPSASAEPGVTTNFPTGASAGYFTGEAFDVCTAPTTSQMATWRSESPYRAIAVYVGGPNRGCSQPNLTSSWVTEVTAKGWKLMPIYVGLQAPCSKFSKSVTASTAAAQGKDSASDAINSLHALGMLSGSIAYADMENYDSTNGSCRDAVLTYLSGYTKEMHRRGYLSGVYGKATSTVKDLSGSYTSTAYARPDAIWMADWNGAKSLTGLPGVPETQWTVHQRSKQYKNDFSATYGGVKLRIDANIVDTPVANVAQVFKANAKASIWAAPSASGTAGGTVAKDSSLKVVCQAPGTTVGGTKVWNKLSGGTYISDSYAHKGATGYTKGVPRCRYAYQVASESGTTMRSAAGAGSPEVGPLAAGALAWAVCQREVAEATGTSKVWDEIQSTRYVPDFDLATASRTTFSPAVPRC